MKNLTRFKLLIVAIFTCMILSSHEIVNASTFTLNEVLPVAAEAAAPIPTSEHTRIVNAYINQLRSMHNRTFQMVQLTLDTPIPVENVATLNQGINSITQEIVLVRRRLREYSVQVENNPIQNRDMLLLFNALNHINTQLLYVEQLSVASSSVQKLLNLEIFFRARSAAADTLTAIEEFMAGEQILRDKEDQPIRE